MPESSSVESLRDFQEKVFARHVLFDLPFPVLGTFLVIALNSWLMQSRVSSAWSVVWVAWAIATTLVRVLFDRRMRVRVQEQKMG